MKKPALVIAAISTIFLAGCDDSTTAVIHSLSGEPPTDDNQAQGFVIEPTDISDFSNGTVSQIGAFYYVHGGSKLSSTKPVNVDVACGIVSGYGSYPILKKHPLPHNVSTTIGGSVGVPTLFKYVLGGVKVDFSVERQVDLTVTNLTYDTLSPSDLSKLSRTLKKSSKCQSIIAELPAQVRPSVFQLVGVAYADITGSVKHSAKSGVTFAGASLSPSNVTDTYGINKKTVAFKIYKAVQ
jgi:hypothetical protein